ISKQDVYYSLNGQAYSTSATISGASRYTWTYGYDAHGRPNRTELPTGTVFLSSYDGLGRIVSESVGTSDSNAVVVRQYEYDGGNPGDSNLTKITEKPTTGDDRVSRYYYDWRDRLVTSKNGVQSTETDGVHRPVFYFDYDNLDEITSAEQYDGDGM